MLSEQQPSKRQPTYTHDAASAAPSSSAAPSAQTGDAGPSRFLTVLVTPKLNFSLQVKPSWKVADDIDQDEVTSPPLPDHPPVDQTEREPAGCTAAMTPHPRPSNSPSHSSSPRRSFGRPSSRGSRCGSLPRA